MSEVGDAPALDRLAARCGILPAYRDMAGVQQVASAETKRALLATMGIDASSDAGVASALAAQQEHERARALPPVAVFAVDEPALTVPVVVPAALAERPVAWTVTAESGETTRGTFVPLRSPESSQPIEDDALSRYRLDLTAAGVALPAGCHRLDIEIAGEETLATTIIVAPTRGYRPATLSGEGKVWGLAVQLYGLRSRRNWGSGDFGDLNALIDFAASAGADVLALNPLHALHPTDPARASPYSPSSRLFGNPLYLDVEAIPEFACCEEARRTVGEPAFEARLRELRNRELVDFAGIASAKRPILDALYRCFQSGHRGSGDKRDAAFSAYLAAGGDALRKHALFDAIAEQLHTEGIDHAADWRRWPLPLRDANGVAVARFAEQHAKRVEFHAWLQWQFEQQLDAAAARGVARVLGVGLLADLAVGIDAGGSEAWSDPQLYGIGASVGAPPDSYNLLGQNWGLPPLIPTRLRESAYAPLIATLRRNMRGAGALRIDHVMGLMRLYWIPDGAPAAAGAYVAYPFNDLLGVLSLESQRNRCLLVGEDLGTVPDEVRAGMRRTGILSLRPMYFETDPGGRCPSPEGYLQDAVVSIGIHDLPTLRGFWQGADLQARRAIGQLSAPGALNGLQAGREREKARLLRALRDEGLLGETDGAAWSPELALAAHRFLARTPSKILLVAMEDVFGQIEQVNLPGTVEEHPNWRRKLERALEDWPKEPAVGMLTAALAEERPSPLPKLPAAQRPSANEAPRATYRLQLNRRFTFADATAIVPYLAALGVSHVYLSPYFKARHGSTHGYDIVDYNALNPEIGTRADLERLSAVLREHGMKQLIDVVPNHVGVLGADNPWWQEVLENGRAAEHAQFFDIDWDRTPDELHGKLLLPVLPERYGTVLERGEIQLSFDPSRGEFSLGFAGQRFPVDPQTYVRILAPAAERLRLANPRAGLAEGLARLAAAFASLATADASDAERGAQRRRLQQQHKRALAERCALAPEVLRCIEEQIEHINGSPADPASFDALDALLRAQVFRLASWRMAADDINYRRFFDLNDLAALRVENPDVFEASHGLLFELVAEANVGGLRVDHPDGLHDPEAYFARLQQRASGILQVEAPASDTGRSKLPLYIVAEKITGSGESLPSSWQIAGTTGYDFAELVNGLFVDPRGEAKLTRGYCAFVDARPDYADIVYRSKRLVMHLSMASELNALASALSRIAQSDRSTCDFTYSSLRAALGEVVASFPVYRTYVTAAGASAEDRRRIDQAIQAARRRALPAERTVFDFLRDVLTTDLARERPPAEREAIIHMAMRFQQFTAPVMAKGTEDTAFYTYNRLLSLNEVGGDPQRFGVSVAAFHESNFARAADWPHAMLSTSTHDSKRSEDVRARINVLSELAAEWRLRVERWRQLNRSLRRQLEVVEAPTANDEYLLYQTLVGAWPDRYDDPAVAAEFAERIERYLVKVVREAKALSSWVNPNEQYEAAFTGFARALLAPGQNERFLKRFLPFQRKVAWFGMLNSLSQTLLKLTAPGVPDIYQGCELWSYSLVDPDNRRPVDFAARQDSLSSLRAAAATGDAGPARLASALAAHLEDGRLKQFVVWRSLEFRRRRELLFRDGAYLPLGVSAERAEHVCAFARVHEDDCAVVVVPRLTCTLLGGETILPLGASAWGDTALDVSSFDGHAWEDVLTGIRIAAPGGRLPLATTLGRLPLALLLRRARGGS